MNGVRMGRWSEEEYLLEEAGHSSNVYPNNQGDLLGSSSDRDVPHKRTRRMETQKYLRESYNHHIECFIANSLAALMKK